MVTACVKAAGHSSSSTVRMDSGVCPPGVHLCPSLSRQGLCWAGISLLEVTSHHGPFSFPPVLHLLVLAAWTPRALLMGRAHSECVLQCQVLAVGLGMGRSMTLTRRIPVPALVVLSTGDPGAVPSPPAVGAWMKLCGPWLSLYLFPKTLGPLSLASPCPCHDRGSLCSPASAAPASGGFSSAALCLGVFIVLLQSVCVWGGGRRRGSCLCGLYKPSAFFKRDAEQTGWC